VDRSGLPGCRADGTALGHPDGHSATDVHTHLYTRDVADGDDYPDADAHAAANGYLDPTAHAYAVVDRDAAGLPGGDGCTWLDAYAHSASHPNTVTHLDADRPGDRHGHPDVHTAADFYAGAQPNVHLDSDEHLYANTATDSHVDGDEHLYTIADALTPACRIPNTQKIAITDADRYHSAVIDSQPYTDPDTFTDSDLYAHAITQRHAYTDTVTQSDRKRHPVAQSDGHCDTDGHPCTITS